MLTLVFPGYFDAPAAAECPVMHLPMEPLPPVTLVFCALEGVSAMRVCPVSSSQCPCVSLQLGVVRASTALHPAGAHVAAG